MRAASEPRRRLGRAFRQYQPLHVEAFENISNFDVIEVGDARAALEPGTYFVRIVFKTFQRTDAASVHNAAFTEHANFGIAFEHAIEHIAPGDNPTPFARDVFGNSPRPIGV